MMIGRAHQHDRCGIEQLRRQRNRRGGVPRRRFDHQPRARSIAQLLFDQAAVRRTRDNDRRGEFGMPGEPAQRFLEQNHG